MRTLIIGVLVVAIFAVTAFFFINSSKKDSNTTSKQKTENSATSSNDTTTTTPASSSATLTYTDSGFSPSTVKLTSGGSVTVKNDSSREIQFDSNPHPAHTDNTELNLGIVGTGQSKSFTVTKKGTWEYHNHLISSVGGTIIVE